MVTSAADLGDNQTKPNNAYLPLYDIPIWKYQTKDFAMVTSAADLGDHPALFYVLKLIFWVSPHFSCSFPALFYA